jgi:hypothetical protein
VSPVCQPPPPARRVLYGRLERSAGHRREPSDALAGVAPRHLINNPTT